MSKVDLSRVKEENLDNILSRDGIDTAGMNIFEKVMVYTRKHGTDNSSELYKELNPRTEEKSQPKKIRKTVGKKGTPKWRPEKAEEIRYSSGYVENYENVGIAIIRLEGGLFSQVYGPLAYETLFELLDTHKVKNTDRWDSDTYNFKIGPTCPKIPKLYKRIEDGCEKFVRKGQKLPENLTAIWVSANDRIRVDKAGFDAWYEVIRDWFGARGVEPKTVKAESGLEQKIMDYMSKVESGDCSPEKNKEISEIAKMGVSLVNQMYKSNPPGWKLELIDRVEKEIKSGLENRTLDIYNRISKIKFERFLKDNGVEYEDIYDAVVNFVKNFGIDALIPFIKYDRAETAGNDAGIDYSPSYITDLVIMPKAKRVRYREEYGFKSEFFEDLTFESNFQLQLDINGLKELHDTVTDIFNVIEYRFRKQDEEKAQKYETKLHLRAYLQTLRNIREKGERHSLYENKERMEAVKTALECSNKILKELL